MPKVVELSTGFSNIYFQFFKLPLLLLTMLLASCALSIATLYSVVILKWDGKFAPAETILVATQNAITEESVGSHMVAYHGVKLMEALPNALSKLLFSLFPEDSNSLAQRSEVKQLQVGLSATAPFRIVIIGLKLWALKLVLFAALLPFPIFCWLVGWLEGLVNRHIRRDEVARERSGLYHRGKFNAVLVTVGVFLIITCTPVQLPWVDLMFIYGIILFMFSRLQWTNFKKYR